MEKTLIPYGYVYRITNKVNGKTYIGRHKLKNESWRAYLGSGSALKNAQRKYGIKNFVKELICYCTTSEELNASERLCISEEIELGRSQYNIVSNPEVERLKSKVSDEELLFLYLKEKLSYPEISYRVGISVPAIFNRLQKYREEYKLEFVSQGRDRRVRDLTNFKRAGREASMKKFPCSVCGRPIAKKNLSRHESSHFYTKSALRVELIDRKCSFEDCTVSVERNKFCEDHRFIGNNSNFGTNGNRNGGLKSAHTRWHSKRGILNPNCSFCSEKL